MHRSSHCRAAAKYPASPLCRRQKEPIVWAGNSDRGIFFPPRGQPRRRQKLHRVADNFLYSFLSSFLLCHCYCYLCSSHAAPRPETQCTAVKNSYYPFHYLPQSMANKRRGRKKNQTCWKKCSALLLSPISTSAKLIGTSKGRDSFGWIV